MATRYTLTMTFGGDESEAWDDWQQFALEPIAQQTLMDYVEGEIVLYDEDNPYRIFWKLEAEDE